MNDEAKTLRDIRKRHGMSQERVAVIAGVTRSVIANIETGRGGELTEIAWLRIYRATANVPLSIVERVVCRMESQIEHLDMQILEMQKIQAELKTNLVAAKQLAVANGATDQVEEQGIPLIALLGRYPKSFS